MRINNKFTKLVYKILGVLFILVVLFFIILHFILLNIVSSNNVKEKIVSILKEQLATDVNIGKLSVSLFDFAIDNLELKIKDTDFMYINRVYIHFSLRKLLFAKIKIKRITIKDFTLYIEKDKDGKFNFEKLIQNAPMFAKKSKEELKQEEETKDEKKDIIDLFLHKTQFQNISIFYKSNQENIKFNLTETYFNADDFNFKKPFKITFYSKIYTFINNIEIDSIFLTFAMLVNLNPAELDKANIDIKCINAKFRDCMLSIKGNVNNLVKPNVMLDMNLTNLSSKTLECITETPDFNIPLIDIKTKLVADIVNNRIDLNSLTINILDSKITANGYLNYSKINYHFNIITNLILEKLQPIAKLIESYKPSGQINSEMLFSDTTMKGLISLDNVCFYTPQLGDFKNINSKIDINSINDIKIPSLTGELNGYPFKANLSYLTVQDHSDIVLNFSANKFIGKMSKETQNKTAKKEETVKENKNKTKEKSSSISHFFTVKANCKINFLDVPFLRANKVLFDMDITNITPGFKNIKGYLKLDSSNGIIKDIYKLTEASALTKGLFLSLKVISNVINTLNVLDLLSSLGSVLKSKDNAIKENEAIVKHQKIDGKIEFSSFLTKLDFLNGNAKIDKCSFVSNLLSFRVKGNMNFKENNLGMTVFTAPGSHEVDDIMPLTMKIYGTMDEPKGSLSLLGSVSSLVGDMLTKNIVSDKLKKGFSALFGLKKNDEKGNEIKEDVNYSTTMIKPSNIETK